MEAPTIGGVRVRKGNGETVRLPRGASQSCRINRRASGATQIASSTPSRLLVSSLFQMRSTR